MEQVQKNAIGVAIIGTITEDDVARDVSGVITKVLYFRKPPVGPDLTQTVVSKTATFVTDGVTAPNRGKIQYITEALFLDTPGVWECQGYVVWAGGFDGRSDVQQFEVKDNL